MAEAFLLQQGPTREKLMEEAMHIQRIVPERNIDEIYSSLEAFFDDPKRVQRVVLKFLDHVKEEDVPKKPRKRNCDDEHNQPSTSGIPPKKSSKIRVKSRADGDNRTETVTNSDTPFDIGVPTQGDSHPAESDKEFKKDSIDVVLDQFNISNNSDSTSDAGSEGEKFNDIKEYLWENEGFAFSSEDEGGDAVDKFIEPVGNENHENMLERNIPVDLTLPGPSNANNNDLIVRPPQLDDSDVVCIDVNGVDNEKKEAYYNSLIEIFPDAQKDFVRSVCDKSTQDENWLSNTISGLLENGYPKAACRSEQGKQVAKQKTVKTEEEKKMMIEENYNNLLAIFPNADPTYIRETCEQIGDDEEAMKKFVSDTLESGKYPTLAEYEERMKVMEIRDKYLKNFKIEEFLDIFPDPFKYFFEEKKNDKTYSELSLNYLKSRYRKIRITLLQECLVRNNYSLTKSCAELDKCRNFMKSKRGEHEIQYCEKDMKNIPFMQEVAFIENKEKIKKYLNEKELKRAEAFKKAKENNELLECGCCYDNEVLAEDTVTCTEGHIFCKTCLQKYSETQIGDGKTVFTCLSNCDAEFSLKTLQAVLKPSVFSKMLQRKQIEEVKSAAIPGLEVCPFCDFATIPPEEDKIFRCLNPDCMKESCRKCKEPNHIPLRCEEVEKPEEVKIRTYIEDRMTQALIRTCWRCEKKFIKIDGCNKMTCTCGALMCYICRQPVKDYTHFNGEGGTEYHKCPLFSKNDDLHVKAVEEEATKARNEALAKNPNIQLKHDPTHILPERTQPDVPDQPNVRFMQYNGRLVPPVHLNFHMPAGAEAVFPPPLLPVDLPDLNWLHPILALGQQRLMVAPGPPVVMGRPRLIVRDPVAVGPNNRIERLPNDGRAPEDGPQIVAFAQDAEDNEEEAPDQLVGEEEVAELRRVRAALAAQRQHRQAQRQAQRQARMAARDRHARAAVEEVQHHQARALRAELAAVARHQRARPAAQQQLARLVAATAAQGQQVRPAAAAAPGQQARPAVAATAAPGQQARPAVAATAAPGQQARPAVAAAAAPGQQARPPVAAAGAPRQQARPAVAAAAALEQEVRPAMAAAVAAVAAVLGQQARPAVAAAPGQQARLAVAAAAAPGQHARPAAVAIAAQRQQVRPGAVVAAAAQRWQVRPGAVVAAAVPGQQVRPGEAIAAAAAGAAAAAAPPPPPPPPPQGQQVLPAAPAAAATQGQQALPAVPVRQALEGQRGVAHLRRIRMFQELPPLAGDQPVARQDDPPVDHPQLTADDFIGHWLANIPPRLEMLADRNRQREQERLPQ